MEYESILEQICRIGIIPVIAIDDAKKAVPLARPLVEGGAACGRGDLPHLCRRGGHAGDCG